MGKAKSAIRAATHESEPALSPSDEFLPISTGYDPVQSALRQRRGFYAAWLKGDAIPPVQRIGFVIFSLLWCFFAIYEVTVGFQMLLEGSRGFFSMLLPGLGMLFIGILALWNVFRRRKIEKI